MRAPAPPPGARPGRPGTTHCQWQACPGPRQCSGRGVTGILPARGPEAAAGPSEPSPSPWPGRGWQSLATPSRTLWPGAARAAPRRRRQPSRYRAPRLSQRQTPLAGPGPAGAGGRAAGGPRSASGRTAGRVRCHRAVGLSHRDKFTEVAVTVTIMMTVLAPGRRARAAGGSAGGGLSRARCHLS